MSLTPARNRMGLLLTDRNSDFCEVPLTECSHATIIFKVVCHISDWFLCHCLWRWYWNRSRSKWVRARPVTCWDGSKIRVTIFIPPNPRPTALLLRCSMWVNELFQFWAVSVHIRPGKFSCQHEKLSGIVPWFFQPTPLDLFMSCFCESNDLCNTYHGNFWWHRTFQFQFMFVWRGRQLKGLGLLIVIHSKLTAGKLVFTR